MITAYTVRHFNLIIKKKNIRNFKKEILIQKFIKWESDDLRLLNSSSTTEEQHS